MAIFFLLLVFAEIVGLALLVVGIVALIRGKLALVSGLRAEGTAARVAGAVLLLILPLSMGGRIFVDMAPKPRTPSYDNQARTGRELFGALTELGIFAACLCAAAGIVYLGRPGGKEQFVEPEYDDLPVLGVPPAGGASFQTAQTPLPMPATRPPVAQPTGFPVDQPRARANNFVLLFGLAGAAATALLLGCIGLFLLVPLGSGKPSQVAQANSSPKDPVNVSSTTTDRWPMQPQPIKPAVLSGPGISTDWQVVFRSHDPSMWDKDVSRDGNFGKSLNSVGDIRYLRIRNNHDYVIVETAKDRLRLAHDEDRYGWNGLNENHCAGNHLGVYDKRLEADRQGKISVLHNDCSGWGFGHIAWVDNRQGYCWNGQVIHPAVLEIAVKSGQLTPLETQSLLSNIKK